MIIVMKRSVVAVVVVSCIIAKTVEVMISTTITATTLRLNYPWHFSYIGRHTNEYTTFPGSSICSLHPYLALNGWERLHRVIWCPLQMRLGPLYCKGNE